MLKLIGKILVILMCVLILVGCAKKPEEVTPPTLPEGEVTPPVGTPTEEPVEEEEEAPVEPETGTPTPPAR